ncbi:MAG: type II toxin-antitoxin system VapC family toxin [Cellulomonadaceae bacterium]|nr:type II toxin-antitoxin system VapC family toxin [Cellulomonadaceae bacterium]
MSRTYLLDTHVVLWLLAEPETVDPTTRAALADPVNSLVVSAASAMEVATKTRLGKLPAQYAALVQAWGQRVRDLRATELPISAQHAILAGSLTWEHRDPFDRLLAAQAIIENVTLVTRDADLTAFAQVATIPA